MDDNKNKNVAVSPDVNRRLDVFCTEKGITKKDFISLSLSYFERYGINPNDHESPAVEMEKILKRINDLIRFFKAQERDIINPTFEAVVTTEERIKADLDVIAKAEHLKVLAQRVSDVMNKALDNSNEALTNVLRKQAENNKARDERINKISDGMYLLAKALEEGKDRKGLADQIKGLFSSK